LTRLFILFNVQFYDDTSGGLSRKDDSLHHLSTMKRVDSKKSLTEQLGRPSTRCRRLADSSLLEFVKALAIADARRDHRAEIDPVPRFETGGQMARQGEASAHDSRSHLRTILD
jgi:hypothetical protein